MNFAALTTLRVVPSIQEAIALGSQILRRRGLESSRLDAELWLAHLLNRTREQLRGLPDRSLTIWEWDKFLHGIERRGKNEPLAYLTGYRYFYNSRFGVTPAVLIPRPETELLVDAVLEFSREQERRPINILEIGTGSGAIAISLVLANDQIQLTATDISNEALAVAKSNATDLLDASQSQRLEFVQGCDVEPFIGRKQFDMIVSNPPYIPTAEINGLSPEIREFEPHLALDGGATGIEFIQKLIAAAPTLLTDGGALILECGWNQSEIIGELLGRSFPGRFYFNRDLASVKRCLVATLEKPHA